MPGRIDPLQLRTTDDKRQQTWISISQEWTDDDERADLAHDDGVTPGRAKNFARRAVIKRRARNSARTSKTEENANKACTKQ